VNRPTFDRDESTRVVTLSTREIRDAVRLLGRLAEHDQSEGGGRAVLIGRARRVIADRRRRIGIFGISMFGEPAWDMLLALYTEDGRQRLTVGKLVNATGHAPTTALRWLDYLETQGFICREAHPLDRRSTFVDLADKGYHALDAYFSETPPNAR
jgi:DNA-binding MarR family transcriptional regulator